MKKLLLPVLFFIIFTGCSFNVDEPPKQDSSENNFTEEQQRATEAIDYVTSMSASRIHDPSGMNNDRKVTVSIFIRDGNPIIRVDNYRKYFPINMWVPYSTASYIYSCNFTVIRSSGEISHFSDVPNSSPSDSHWYERHINIYGDVVAFSSIHIEAYNRGTTENRRAVINFN